MIITRYLLREILGPFAIVELDPRMPALRADSADVPQKTFHALVIVRLPVLREAFPIGDVHSGEHVRDFDRVGGPAAGKHRGKSFGARQAERQAARGDCGGAILSVTERKAARVGGGLAAKEFHFEGDLEESVAEDFFRPSIRWMS